jgi:archaemetzincin
VIYLLPLDEQIGQEMTEFLVQYCSVFFNGVTVCALPSVNVDSLNVTSRGSDRYIQYHAGEILSAIVKMKPKDAFCLTAFTMHDIYPRESWNYVFGLANSKLRTGVFSFHRYTPAFNYETNIEPEEERETIWFRSAKVMSHEICHLFGIKH